MGFIICRRPQGRVHYAELQPVDPWRLVVLAQDSGKEVEPKLEFDTVISLTITYMPLVMVLGQRVCRRVDDRTREGYAHLSKTGGPDSPAGSTSYDGQLLWMRSTLTTNRLASVVNRLESRSMTQHRVTWLMAENGKPNA